MSGFWIWMALACSGGEGLPDYGGTVLFAEDTAAAERPRNVLMISLDTTRRDWLGPWREASITPNLDALFDRGLLLSDHRSCSNWTYASVLCIQAGARGTKLGFVPSTAAGDPGAAPDSLTLASEHLRGLGWYTSLVTANDYFSASNNLAQGFEVVDFDSGRKADRMTDAGVDALRGALAQPDPWYLHLHYLDPHAPYSPPEDYQGGLEGLAEIEYALDTTRGYSAMNSDWDTLDAETRALVLQHIDARYGGELAYADAEIGRFLAAAEAAGALDDTLVVFWTDHGEQHYEHGKVGHKYALYEQENRAVAAFVAPGIDAAVWGGPTSHQDLWPTALAALGLPAMDTATGVPVGARSQEDARFATRHSGNPIMQFVERDGVKLIYWWSGEKALHRLEDDPDEQRSIYSPQDPEVLALWELLAPEVQRLQLIHSQYTPVDPAP